MGKWKFISGVKWFDAKDKKQAKFGGKSPMLFYYFFSSQVIPRKAEEHLKGMELQ